MIYLMIVSVNVASVMIVLELFFSMKNKIMNSIENFFISLRLKGAKNVLEYVKFDQEQIGNIDLSN